jgi:zinc transporter
MSADEAEGGIADGNDGLIHARLLDGRGAARELGWDGVRDWRSAQGALWAHLDRDDPRTDEWLRAESGLDPVVIDALLAEETRPRCAPMSGGIVVILRGVNLNPGADPEDMVSLRVWLGEARIITVRRRRGTAVDDVLERLDAGSGPNTAAEVLVVLAERLIDEMAPVVEDLDDNLDALEVEALTEASDELRPQLAAFRRQAITLRRHIAPQREALLTLWGLPTGLLQDRDRTRVREVCDRITRHVEDLDALRERAAVTHEELGTWVAEVTSRRMYIMALVSAVFLPLGMLTGLLGVNLGGVPGTQNEWAFWILTAALGVIGAATVWLLRVRRLF